MRLLKEINKDLNEEYPKFLKEINKKETEKAKHKRIMKHPVWSLLEELRKCLM
mgnify:CR=1 FL=1